MFAIWKNDTPSTYAQIAAKHAELFGEKKRKKSGSVKVIVNAIKHLEDATQRKYLNPYGGRPSTYEIHRQSVELERTAVIMLELSRGYRHFASPTQVRREIEREVFVRYISDKYGWTQSFIEGRLDDTSKGRYLSFEELEEGKIFIDAEPRLNHDIEYIKLVFEDYLNSRQLSNPDDPETTHLKTLLALYHSDSPSQKHAGGIA